MLKNLLSIFLVAIISMFIVQDVEAAEQPTRYIGLHDKELMFESGEIRLEKGNMIVPLNKMAKYLYANILENDKTYTVTKNGQEIQYNKATGQTTLNGKMVSSKPIIVIKGKLYIQIRFLGESTGFKVDYLSNIGTARLTSEFYKSMSHVDYSTTFSKQREVKSVQSKPSSSKPTVYLTFDDGPNKFTTTNLKILSNYNVKGTFFFVGKQINEFPNIVKQTANEAHAIGVHSMTHDRTKVYASSKAFIGEMNKANELIKNITGKNTSLLRAPYGSNPYVTNGMANEMKNSNYKMWDWDVDSNDWQYTESNYKQIVVNVKDGVLKADKSNDKHIVILLHDRVQTTKALPEIISWLQQQGYNIQPYDPSNHIVQNFLKDKSL